MLIEADPRNREVVEPFLNGRDLNSSIDHSPTRWVINFREMDESTARTYFEPWFVVERLVRPERVLKDAVKYPRMVNEWWKFWNPRVNLYESIATLSHVLVIARVSKTLAFARVPTGQVFDEKLVVVATEDWADLAALSSAMHTLWAIKYGTTMRTDATYTPRGIFETFPRPPIDGSTMEVGRNLEAVRRRVMQAEGVGLTALYNMVNSREVQTSAVQEVREAHVAIDEVAAAAYGWHDLKMQHGFYDVKGVQRFTLQPAIANEVLARLLEENYERAASRASGMAAHQLGLT